MDGQNWLSTWLHNLNLQEYLSNFAENGYESYEHCMRIDKKELKRIGVSKVGHLNRLYRALEKLRNDAGVSPCNSSGASSPENFTSLPPNESLPSDTSEHLVTNHLPLASSRGVNSTRNPPPVPMRKSTRKKSPSASPSPSPTPFHPENISNEGSSVPNSAEAQGSASSLNPPPIFPRQQSLKRLKKPPSAAKLRANNESPAVTNRAAPSQLSPVPQSPATGIESELQFPLPPPPVVRSKTSQSHSNGSSVPQHMPVRTTQSDSYRSQGASSAADLPPKLSPKTIRKVLPASGTSPPSKSAFYAPGKESDLGPSAPFLPPKQENVGLLNFVSSQPDICDHGNKEVPEKEFIEPQSPLPPELPPKKSATAKRIIIPDEDVVFELENIPMPQASSESFNGLAPGEINVSVPLLPPRNTGAPSFTPPPPPHATVLSGSTSHAQSSSTVPHADRGSPSSAPPTRQSRSLPADRVPPPPPPRKSTLQNRELTSPLPPLPPRNGGVPLFTPPPPMEGAEIAEVAEITEPVVSQQPHPISPPPPLPPKVVHEPPPPPPITKEDFPEPEEDYSDSEEERDTPFFSISSTGSGINDNILTISGQGIVKREECFSSSTGLSSPESEPTSTFILQQQVSPGRDDVIIALLPSDKDRDYENQEVIDEAEGDDKHDYANQDAIDESIMIRGTAPIKSRTDEDKDYENQDVLDEDIIPFGTLPSEGRTSTQSKIQRQGQIKGSPDLPRRGFECSDGVCHLPVAGKTSAGKEGLTFSNSEEISLDVKQHVEAAPRHPIQRGVPKSATTHITGQGHRPVPKPRSRTVFKKAYAVPVAEDDKDQQLSAGSVSSSSSTPGSLDGEGEGVFGTLQETGLVPPPRLYAASVPLDTTDYFNGPSPLPRSAGTFAGVADLERITPTYRKMASTGTLADSSTSMGSINPSLSRLGSLSLSDVPKTKEGWLYKKGGKRSERPWQRRWVTFNGSELKYFKNQINKVSESLNIVKLGEMIDIKSVTDQEKCNRFDLVVINRVFQFYADTPEDSVAWVNVLHAAISRFRPQDHQFKEGGNMHDPDKQSFMLKQGHGLSKGFKERYIALKGSKFAYYETKEDFSQGRPIHILDMSLANVRPDMSGKFRFIITMTNQKSYVFQSANDQERREWLEMLTNAILTGLDARPLSISRGKSTTSQDVLGRIQENPANTTCADCASPDPVWGVVNLGIMVCINCSGVHRAMGTHISKVRSIELDQQIWTDTLIKLMVTIGNNNSNSLWEKHCTGDRLPADVEREIRETFIRAKYQTKSWIPRSTGESRDTLSRLLCVSVSTDNLLRTVELLALGANPCYNLPDSKDPELNNALAIAKAHNQDLQVELLEQNGALICIDKISPVLEINKRGHLYKTGSDRTGWKRRWCTLDAFRGFEYFKSETDSELLGDIKMDELLSVSRCELDESSKDPKYRHCFEVNTQGRGYLFCADSEEEMVEWIQAFEQIISSDAADKLGYDKVGYLRKRDPHNVGGWKRRWFTLKGKDLKYYRREREEVAVVDLRKVMELKSPDTTGPVEFHSIFQIILPERVYHLRAETPQEAESWISALKHTQVSGIPLSEQQLTGNGLPILVHKCLQFVESYGMETQGLYRLSGEKAKIRKLILAFNQDARGVQIDPESYTVHDVTGTLKQFFRSLPDPLMTHQLYAAFIDAARSTDHEQQLYQLQSLIEQLPQVNRETLKRIISHLRRVIEHESKNKMGLSNLVRLFGPTLMNIEDDPVSFENTAHEYTCVHTMIKYYKWLFQVDEDEDRKEEAIEHAVQRIKEAELRMKTSTAALSSSTDFLTTIYIGTKEGDTYGTKITGTTTVGQVVELVATQKTLPPANYALYLVLGDSESHRVLCSTERLLAILYSTGSDHFLCLKRNNFAETIQQYADHGLEPVSLHVREKKKWKKYPCSVRGGFFVQYKDNKLHTEVCRLPVSDFDMFAGIERSKIDVKNPMPSRYCFWLRAMRIEDNSKFLCTDSEQDMLKMMAAIIKAKYPNCLQTPVVPRGPPPPSPDAFEPSGKGLIMAGNGSPMAPRQDHSEYANVKFSGRPR